MKLSERISRWIRDQVEAAGAAGVLVGLSGGIDSAVVAVLAKRAMGDNVLALLLPCHSLGEDERDGLVVADTFGIRRERVDLSPSMMPSSASFRTPGRCVRPTSSRA